MKSEALSLGELELDKHFEPEAPTSRFLMKLAAKAKWVVPRPASSFITARFPYLVTAEHTGRTTSGEAVGLVPGNDFGHFSTEFSLPPGRYLLQLTDADMEFRQAVRFGISELPLAPLRRYCTHPTDHPSYSEHLTGLAPNGVLLVTYTTACLESCCLTAMLKKSAGGRYPETYTLYLYQSMDHPLAYQVGDRSITVPPGHYGLVNPGEMSRPLPNPAPLHYRRLAIQQPMLRQLREAIGMPQQAGPFEFDSRPVPLTPLLSTLLRVVEDALKRVDLLGSSHAVEAVSHLLLLTLLRSHPNRLDTDWKKHGGNVPRDPRLRRAVNYMASHLAEAIEIGQVAAEAGLSEDQFRKLFLQQLRMTPVEYLQGIRLEKARALLRETNYTGEHIAQLVGYRDLRSFRRIFQAHAGLSLSLFRKEK